MLIFRAWATCGFEVGFGQFFIFSLRYINVTLGLLPPRGHVVWRDSVGVGSSRSGLKIRVRGYFSSELYRVVAGLTSAKKGKTALYGYNLALF